MQRRIILRDNLPFQSIYSVITLQLVGWSPFKRNNTQAKTPILRVRTNIMTLKCLGSITFIYSLTKLLHCYVIRGCSFAVCGITRVHAKVVGSFRRQRQRTFVMRRVNTIHYCSASFKPGEISRRICIHCALHGRHLANP